MALTDPYATVPEYRASFNEGSSSADNDQSIRRQLRAVSRYLERRLGQNFNKVDEAESRLFVPVSHDFSWPTVIDIDPIYSLSGLVVKEDVDNDGDFADETAVTASYYRLIPLRRESGEPYSQLEVTPYGQQGAWSRTLQITSAFWGYERVPDVIVESTIELVRIWRIDSPRATSRINELQQVVSTSRRAQSILDELMSVYSETLGFGIG